MRTLRILSTVACALVGLALVVSSSQAAPRRHSSTLHKSGKARASAKHVTRVAAKPSAPMAGAAGMVIAVDPTDGSLRMPTAEEMQALGAAMPSLNESAEGLVPVQVPGVGLRLDPQGRFQDYAVVRIGKDGKPIFGCGKSVAGAMSETYTDPNRPAGALEDK